MPHAVLITQCLQRDFVEPLAPHEPLPNALHVGRTESVRLVGADPATGPLNQLMHWARAQDPRCLDMLHVRDWHDASDPGQSDHLARFGHHCLAGTTGAELVLGLDSEVVVRPNERFVDAVTLNDFEGTRLADEIRAIAERSEGGLRVGVVGVWTEAKVTFLLYELLTRCRVTELATCSALTASASRAQHFNALEQLRRILGVRVCDSVGEFAEWLVPDGPAVMLPAVATGARPRVVQESGARPIAGGDLDLLAALYRDSAVVELDALSGGFSGASVYRALSRDSLGHQQAPSVLKLGPRLDIAKERVAFEQVESILGNDAPSIRGFADLGQRAGLKFAYAAMGRGHVETFKGVYEEGASEERVRTIFEGVFDDILGRFFAVAQYERLPLLAYYGFESRYAGAVAQQVEEVMGLGGEQLCFPGGYSVSNVASFYAEVLDALPRASGESHYVSYLHGDLNGANILLDSRDNVWLIDFAHAHRGHVLRDLAKLENDVLYIFTSLAADADLEQALSITRALRSVKDLGAALPGSLEDLKSPPLVRAWQTVRALRERVAVHCHEDRDPVQLSVALLRYAVHTLSFDESSPTQKRWALAAACGHAEDVAAAAQSSRALRIDWLDDGHLDAPGRVGLTICPGRRDRDRRVEGDLSRIIALGGRRLVSLLTGAELEWAGVSDLGERASLAGITHRHEPIVDQGVPPLEVMEDLITWLLDGVDRGEDTVLHCMGGLGRSGLVAACMLVDRGRSPAHAIALVRQARGPRAVETSVQVDYVREWSERHC